MMTDETEGVNGLLNQKLPCFACLYLLGVRVLDICVLHWPCTKA